MCKCSAPQCLKYMAMRASILQQSLTSQYTSIDFSQGASGYHTFTGRAPSYHDMVLLRKPLVIAISVCKRVLFVVRVFEGSDVFLETSRGFLPLVELAEMVVCHCLQIVRLCCHLMVLHMTPDLAYVMSEAFVQSAQDVRF
jgi:hypothetical protein